MNHLRRVAIPAYLLAAILATFATMEFLQAVWPLRVGELGWRMVATGLLSRTLAMPLMALLLACVAALLLEQPRALRALAVVNAVLALFLVLGLGSFALDALQMRTQVGPDSRTGYDLALVFSFTKFLMGLGFLVVLGKAEWRAAAAFPRPAGRHGAASERLVVRHPERERLQHETAHAEPVRSGQPDAPVLEDR